MPERVRIRVMFEGLRPGTEGMILGIANYASRLKNWMVNLSRFQLDEHTAEELRALQWDGLIVRISDRRFLESIASLNIPIVDLQDDIDDFPYPTVRPDNFAYGDAGARYFAERGFKRFAFYGWIGDLWSTKRRNGFVHAIERAGHPCSILELPKNGDNMPALARENTNALVAWLKSIPAPFAVMAASDLTALEVIDACRAARLPVPEDVAVLGCGDETIRCRLSDPPLSSLGTNADRIGYEAAAMLDALMHGKKRVESVAVQPVPIATRGSTDVFAVEDQHIAAAMRFIHEHACEDVTIEDVARHAGLSRRPLECRFKEHMGRTLKEELDLARLRRVKELLLQSDFPLSRIADQTGFKHPEYLNVFFKRLTGVTPGKFREHREPEEKAS